MKANYTGFEGPAPWALLGALVSICIISPSEFLMFRTFAVKLGQTHHDITSFGGFDCVTSYFQSLPILPVQRYRCVSR